MRADLPTRLFHTQLGRRVFQGVVLVFVLIQVAVVGRRALPDPFSAKLPWRMFAKPALYNQTITFSGVTQAGEVISIDATRWFRFRSGAEVHPVYTTHSLMWGGSQRKRSAQRQVCLWLARRIWQEDGVRLQEVWLDRSRTHLHSGVEKVTRTMKVAVSAADLVDVPGEAGAPR